MKEWFWQAGELAASKAFAGALTLEDLVLKIVGDHLGIPAATLSLDTHIMNDLGADSLDRLELLMTVEELFEIKIAQEDVSGIERIGDIVEAIKKVTPRATETDVTSVMDSTNAFNSPNIQQKGKLE